jgi:BirA family transcriptional regulator, biotin operon repressor / biotin---[acetyl-CoA-carboxylase] ligase
VDRVGRPGAVLTATIRTVASTGSTNADLLAIAASGGAAEGLWLSAERQLAGRGRHGRTWTSPPGNLYASTLVALRPGDPGAATLALVAAVALEEVARLFLPDSAPPLLKWPNDLLVGGAKLSGILLERSGDWVVIGFGVNLAHHPDDTNRPATSIAAHAPAPAAETFLEALAEAFARWLAEWRRGLAPVRTRWLARAHAPGTALSIRLPDGVTLDGLFAGLTADGALILRLADGTSHVMHAGDVFLL